MPLVAGRILLEDRVEEGWLRIEDGRIAESGDGRPDGRPDATGWIVPAPVNAHTHVADTFLRDVPGKPASLQALVGPGGWKQQRLAAAGHEEQAAGVAKALGEMAAVGTTAFIDFRERGVPGIRWMRKATEGAQVQPILLGRPAANDHRDEEAAELLAGPDAADGIGLSAMRDFPRMADVEAWAEAAHRAHKPFALHVSEAEHESMEAALALEPAFVVHACHATARELEACADQGVAVVACPRSNARFGMRTPIRRMLDAGVKVAVGTDNGMLQDADVLGELGFLRGLDPRLSLEELLRMATWNGRAVAGLPTALPARKGTPLDLIVLPDEPLRTWAPLKPSLAPAPQPGGPGHGGA